MKAKNTLQLCVRSEISPKLIFCKLCDTPIARITGCVLMKDIGPRLPLELQSSYQGQQGDVNQSVRGNYKTFVLEGDAI